MFSLLRGSGESAVPMYGPNFITKALTVFVVVRARGLATVADKNDK